MNVIAIYGFLTRKKMDDMIQAINYAPNKKGYSLLRPNQRTVIEHYMKGKMFFIVHQLEAANV